MLVCVNSKLGHFNDQILLPKESLKPIIFMDIMDMLDQISWAYNHHCIQCFHCPTGFTQIQYLVIVSIIGRAFSSYG
jgi:hypothetical protein